MTFNIGDVVYANEHLYKNRNKYMQDYRPRTFVIRGLIKEQSSFLGKGITKTIYITHREGLSYGIDYRFANVFTSEDRYYEALSDYLFDSSSYRDRFTTYFKYDFVYHLLYLIILLLIILFFYTLIG